METYAMVVVGDRRDRGAEVARWPVTGAGRPTLAVVDEIARLHVVAKRAGYSVRLLAISADLAGLLDLVGLVDVCGQSEVPE
jgi:hypothetical protein